MSILTPAVPRYPKFSNHLGGNSPSDDGNYIYSDSSVMNVLYIHSPACQNQIFSSHQETRRPNVRSILQRCHPFRLDWVYDRDILDRAFKPPIAPWYSTCSPPVPRSDVQASSAISNLGIYRRSHFENNGSDPFFPPSG